MSADVGLWWIGADAADDRLMDIVRERTGGAFGLHARVIRHADRPYHAFDPKRGQHSSTAILKWLVERHHAARRVLAITDVDLFIPVLTFVYGEAQLGGRAAVVSTARLALAADGRVTAAVATDRLIKECMHELGHCFGLLHCDRSTCVMARSVNLVEVDSKAPVLCDSCEARFRELRKKDRPHE